MKNKRLAVAFTGPSNSGKTTLIVKVSNTLQAQGYKVAIVKHDPKDKARFDTPGKDSYKFYETGADVAVVSPEKTTMFKHTTSSIDQLVDMFDKFDFLLVEGLKTLPLPRICVMRNNINKDYFDVSDSIAVDHTINKDNIPDVKDILDLNDTNSIVQWILKNAKAV
jgi:molybdopterin-guanine dinucleotide biosynthesis protein B